MPTFTISEILGNVVVMAGDIFILLGLVLATLALFFAILGKLSPKMKQQKEDLRFGAWAVFLLVILMAMFIGKLMTADLATLQNGLLIGLSNSLFIVLWIGIVFMVVITAVISISGKTKA